MLVNLLRALSLSIQPLLLMATLSFFQQRQQLIDEYLINGVWKIGNNPMFNWYSNKTRYQVMGLDNEGWQSRANCSRSKSFEGQRYTWKPKNKSIVSFPKKKPLCDIIGGRDVIVIGDSMSAQFFMTFLLIIWPWPEGKSMHDYYNLPRSNFKSTQTYTIPCSIPFNVSYIRNIYLSLNRNDSVYMLNRTELKLPPKKVIAYSWIQILEQNHTISRNNIFVLNRGAHYTLDDTLISELTQTFTYIQQHYKDSTIIYRDTAKGHPRVKKYREDVPLKKELPKADYDEVEWNTYNYSQFTHQNNLVRNLIVTKFPHIMYMNIAKATNLRRDSHLDALHYCLPGPVDQWVKSFFMVLRIHQKCHQKTNRLALLPDENTRIICNTWSMHHCYYYYLRLN